MNPNRPRKLSLLARMAQFTGLAIVVMLCAIIAEIVIQGTLAPTAFRSGMLYAYMAGISLFIAFPDPAENIRDDINKTAGLTVVGLVLWFALGVTASGFELAAALTGLWYTVLIRRIGL